MLACPLPAHPARPLAVPGDEVRPRPGSHSLLSLLGPHVAGGGQRQLVDGDGARGVEQRLEAGLQAGLALWEDGQTGALEGRGGVGGVGEDGGGGGEVQRLLLPLPHSAVLVAGQDGGLRVERLLDGVDALLLPGEDVAGVTPGQPLHLQAQRHLLTDSTQLYFVCIIPSGCRLAVYLYFWIFASNLVQHRSVRTAATTAASVL